MKLLIIPNYTREKTNIALDKVISVLDAHKCEYTIDESEGKSFIEDSYDLIISLGGDGTFLRSAKLAYKMDIPIVGINTGYAGYLTNISIDDIEDSLKRILNEGTSDNCREDILITCDRNGEEEVVINELALIRVSNSALFTVHTNGEEIFRTYSTGLVFTTPIGSTGYNLSAGGSVLDRDDNKFEITAICPNIKCDKSLVVDCDKEYVVTCNKDVYSSLDGNEAVLLKANTKIIIKKTDKKLLVKS